MGTLEFPLLLLIGTLWNAHRIGSCKFGRSCDYPCHCLDNAVCNPLDGSCPSGCDDGNLRQSEDYWYTGAWSGFGCQIGNVAYNKNAKQSTTPFHDWRAGLALDGNHNPNMSAGHCAHPGRLYYPGPAWWQVDLGSTYVVSNINITNRGDCCELRTAYLNIYVSGAEGDENMTNLCHSVGSEGRAANTYVSCTQLMVGRYVRLKRTYRYQPETMNICEVQVFGYLHQDCPDDHFGVACGTPCNCHCDDLVGECVGPCHDGWIGSNCQIPLPVLNSVVWLSSASQTTLTISFVPWNSTSDTVYIPAGYKVQWRVKGSTAWITEIEIQHGIDIDNHTAMIRNLEPDTAYYIRIVPFFVEGNRTFYSFVLQESGPFQTNEAGVSGFPVAAAAGIPIGLFVLVVSIVAVALLVRRHMLRGKDSRQHPVVVLESTKPSLYEDVGPGGQENQTYEDIAEYRKTNGDMVYYNTPSTSTDQHVQSDENERITNIYANADIILHGPSLTLFTSDDQESSYEKLGTPSQEHVGFNKNQCLVQDTNVGNAFLDALQAEETSIPSSDITIRYPELQQSINKSGLSTIQGQYVLLQCSRPSRKSNTKQVAINRENLPKNRDSTIVPSNIHRAHLATLIDGRNDYINAVVVDGYRNRKAYIATQLPTTNTVVDFWRLVYDHKSSFIIALQQPDPEDESTPLYWPATTETEIDFGILRVTLIDEDSPDEGLISMMEFEITISKKKSHNVRLYQFLAWPADAKTSLSMEKSLMLLNHAQRCQLRSGQGPLCFICKFGYERCGLMIAACYMLEKLNVDREVDVFHAVKQVRNSRPEFVTSLAQYEFLYELAIAYINCEEYTNFK